MQSNKSSSTNTKVPRPLFLNIKEWQRITEQIDKNQQSVMHFENDLDYEEYLKNGSREMTKNWENTVKKNRLRKDDERKKVQEEKKAEGNKCLKLFIFIIDNFLFIH